jgi:hypothetical protein
VILTEGRPDETGLIMARVLEELRVPVTVILDSGVGYAMERCAVILGTFGCGPVVLGSPACCRVALVLLGINTVVETCRAAAVNC